MVYGCTDCGFESDVEDITNLNGQCRACGNHHGNVIYASRMTKDEFIIELAKMSEKDIAKYAEAIKICAEDIVENDLF